MDVLMLCEETKDTFGKILNEIESPSKMSIIKDAPFELEMINMICRHCQIVLAATPNRVCEHMKPSPKMLQAG